MEIIKPTNGIFFTVENLNDNIFSKKLLGDCIAFTSEDGKVFSPIDGEIIMAYPTGHAFAIKNNDIKLLIHVGLSSITLKGKGFISFVDVKTRVNKGDRIVEFDKRILKKHNINDVVILTLTSNHNFVVKDKIEIVEK